MDNDAGFLYSGQSRGGIRRDAKYITVDTHIERIPAWRLSSMEVLVWLELPDQLKVIGNHAFYCCFVLQRVIFSDCLIHICPSAFAECHELNPVVLPEGLLTIGEDAFRCCRSLRQIEVPSTVEIIGHDAFAACSSLRSAVIPDFIEYVDMWFGGCGSLRHVTVSSKATAVRSYALSDCRSLLSLELPETISSIEQSAFYGCFSLRNIFIPPNVPRSDAGAPFHFCDDLLDFFPSHQISDALASRFDDLPVHRICYFQVHNEEDSVLAEIRQSLASEDFETLQDSLGMTPLHILALSIKPRFNLWREIQSRFPLCLEIRDKWGSRPIDYLVENPAPGSLRLLASCIHANTGTPLKGLRSAKWKFSLLRLIEELNDNSDRRTQVDRIHDLLSKFLRMEATSVLEEAIWKAQMNEQAKESPTLSVVGGDDDRTNYRIRCGADIVIPNVLSFLGKRRMQWLRE